MLEMKITIEAPELAASISKLADAIAAGHRNLYTEPAQADDPNHMEAPVAPVNQAAPVVPVSDAPAYTLDQIARAGAALVDAGKMDQLLALLGQYGVRAVTQLQPEQYGAFATELRGLGAQI